ncbi:MAG: stage III sporulation protein AB [Clostridia bacterium]|nr:stage III sporulation protein AB [Clostridia bacterium]
MRLIFKLLGFMLIIIVCCTIGFIKANELQLRCKKLEIFKKGILEFKERLRLSYGELDRLKSKCFKTPIDYSGLYKGDSEIIESMFREIPLLDRENAYNRCTLAVELLNKQYAEAQTKQKELGKLYKSIGVLGGIFICILFL